MSTRLNFFFTEAIRSLTTNVATTVAAILTTLFALAIVGGFLALFYVANQQAQVQAEDLGRVKVFLLETASESEVNALRGELENMNEVKSVTYVSKDDALVRAREIFKDDPEILKNLPGNPFPASLEAKLHDPSKVREVASRFEKRPGVDETEYGGEKIEQWIERLNAIKALVAIAALLLVITATLLVANTIRLSIFARRREIEVMKLVGASNSFVRLPFMIEGFLCGLAGAIGAVLLIAVMHKAFEPFLAPLTTSGQDVPEFLGLLILLGMGVVLGGLGSGLTIRRFLRV